MIRPVVHAHLGPSPSANQVSQYHVLCFALCTDVRTPTIIVDCSLHTKVAMRRPLPIKLQLQILGHLEWDFWEADERLQTLASFCLVCQAWCGHFQRELLRAISLRTRRHLTRLVMMLSSVAHLIGTYTTRLSLCADV